MNTANKIIALDNISHLLRGNVVLCHGVFDVLHMSHIEYLEKSKTYGDMLVVSVTDDPYVNKGPNKPYFNIHHRCKIISSLACVDYVIISPEPSAKTVINIVKPKFYSKGIEYKNRPSLTGKINIENRAVQSYGGRTIYIKTNKILSSSAIVNNLTLTQNLRNYIDIIKQKYSIEHIYHIIDSLRNIDIVLIGETIIDKYIYGNVIGKSSKYPCLVFQQDTVPNIFNGGILAVAKQLSNFVKTINVITYIGDDNYRLKNLPQNVNIYTVIKKNTPTIIKCRYVDKYTKDRLFETYQMNDKPLNKQERNCLHNYLGLFKNKSVPKIGIDYGHGFLDGTESLFAINCQSNAGNRGYNYISKYKNVDHMVLDEQEMRLESRDKHQKIIVLNEQFMQKTNVHSVTTTVGSKGCIITDKNLTSLSIPTITGSVIDTIGAGDAFFGIFTCLIYIDTPYDLSGFLANIAGYLTTQKIGDKLYNPIVIKQTINSLMK